MQMYKGIPEFFRYALTQECKKKNDWAWWAGWPCMGLNPPDIQNIHVLEYTCTAKCVRACVRARGPVWANAMDVWDPRIMEALRCWCCTHDRREWNAQGY